MIGKLKGEVVHRGNGFVILDVNGVGYKIFTAKPSNELFIHHHIREDINHLYGFATPDELAFFEQLLGVSGVGPKVAMTIMAAGDLEKLRDSIIKSDTSMLTAISGIGGKLATKIVVDLKPKLVRGGDVNLAHLGQESAEVIEALQSLGYQRKEITGILAKIPVELTTTQQKVTWALKHLTRSTGSGSI